MSNDFLIHDHSVLVTGLTIAAIILGELALYARARIAAAICALASLVAIALNLAIGRPIDIALGPAVGFAPWPEVDDVTAYGRLVSTQTILLVLAASVLIWAYTNKRPRLF